MDHIRRFGRHTFASLTIRNYRLYFIGQSISFSGTWMQTIAQGLLVLKLTGSGTILGIILGLQFLPILFLAPFAGVFIDRFSKRKIIFFTQTAAGLLALSLGLLVISNLIQVWMIYLFALCLGLVTALDNPARQTFLPELVGKDLLKNAVSLNNTMVNFARIVGPALAGVLAATVGLGPCFIINALSYSAVLIILLLLDTQNLHTVPKTLKQKGQLKEGFEYVRSTPVLTNTLLMVCIIGTLTYNFSVILPLFATFTFHSSAGYAILTTAMSTGAVFGGLFSASKGKASPQLLIITAVLFGTSMLLVSIMPTLITATLCMILVGAFSVNFISIAATTLQLEAAPHMRGRVMALWSMAFLGTTPIGAPIIGWIGEHLGPRWGIAIGGIAALVAAGIGALLMTKAKTSNFKRVITSKIT